MAEESRIVADRVEPVAAAPALPKPGARTERPPRATLVAARLNPAGEDRRRLIAETAYFRAERRGFRPGQELEDWLAAEIEVDALLGADDGIV